VIGLTYSFLPFMILPLYASIERIDWRLVEASRDLYSTGWKSFTKVVLPLSLPGVIAGSILVFVPSLGAYVTPEILGGGRETMLGSYIVTQFLTARNWPVGASVSFVLMTVMLAATIVYFRAGGKNL
jgi:spermidine/putrescine transport system permease protein